MSTKGGGDTPPATLEYAMNASQQHYNTGWNDIAHGILTWTPGCNAKYSSALEWAIAMKKIAQEQGGTPYLHGCIAAVDQYQSTGRIEKVESAKAIYED